MDDPAQLRPHLEKHDRRFDEHDRQFALVRQEVKDEAALLRQEIKDEAALLRQEIKDEAALLRQEIKDSTRGLHLRFERLEDTMRMVAERVSEFNQESRALRSRVTGLETSQVNTDLRLIALERKKRKS